MRTKKIISLFALYILSSNLLIAGEIISNAKVKSFALNVRATPFVSNSNKLFVLKKNQKVVIYNKVKNWCKINKNKKQYVSCKYLTVTSIEEINRNIITKESSVNVNLMNIVMKLINEVEMLKEEVKMLKEKTDESKT